jgi:hypothetical protein
MRSDLPHGRPCGCAKILGGRDGVDGPRTVQRHRPTGLVPAVAGVYDPAAGLPLDALRHCQARVARLRPSEAVPGRPGSYARGGEAARNSTFTRAVPVRTIASRRAAS